ncbi:uncharacterized protein LOC129599984 [Paramacrobiotus metropolitanus]|uniref:uncharacterized protein LOC129599984 n=1 Tax=Paramacrobiotus metropolitanus TaxID=2943436 RepID=UPI00244631FE|nr:uncharacterized protein LOC129599984 [Paramacrobiotus metropolitanus]XP_055354334.1 uncharacterized protein LOC129599984 [Paramacrobiotus metropolitanus]
MEEAMSFTRMVVSDAMNGKYHFPIWSSSRRVRRTNPRRKHHDLRALRDNASRRCHASRALARGQSMPAKIEARISSKRSARALSVHSTAAPSRNPDPGKGVDAEDPDPDTVDYVALCAPTQPVIHRGFLYRRAPALDTPEHLAYACAHGARRREACQGGLYMARGEPQRPVRIPHCHRPNYVRCFDLYLQEAALRHLREQVLAADNPRKGYQDFYGLDRELAKLLPTWSAFQKHYRAELKAAKERKCRGVHA